MSSRTRRNSFAAVFLLLLLLFPARAEVEVGNSAGRSVVQFDPLRDHVVLLPQVASGRGGSVTLSTVISVSNPGCEDALVTIVGQLFESFELAAGGTRLIELESAELMTGYARISSDQPLSVVGHIVSRTVSNPGIPFSRVSIPALEARTKFVLPVFRGHVLAQDTALAFRFERGGAVRAILRDLSAAVVAERDLIVADDICLIISPPCVGYDFFSHFALFLGELFPDLPEDFQEGSLTVERIENEAFTPPPNVAVVTRELAYSFAMVGLYIVDNRLHLAPARAIDVEVDFSVLPATGVDPAELETSFGIELLEGSLPNTYLFRSSAELARVVARDRRVLAVEPAGGGAIVTF